MFLKDILSISGKGGLFKFIKQARNGIIVESLLDNKRTNAPASAKVSSLEDITIFTEGEEDMKLEEIMKKIFKKENGGQAIDPKSSNEELKAYFNNVLPEYDKERVYVSDIKKIISWYNILQNHNMIKIEEEKEEDKKETEDNKQEIAGEKEKIKPEPKNKPIINKGVTEKKPVKRQTTSRSGATKKPSQNKKG